MNKYTLPIGTFIRFDVLIINTLEYSIKKDVYDVAAFEARKNAIVEEITKNTPLKNCCDNSKEAGKNLLDKINELVNTVYSEDSTIVKVSQDKTELRVDYSQAIAIFELVEPIHEEIRKIIGAHLSAARQNNEEIEQEIIDVLSKEEYFYRGLINMLMLEELDHQFAEYNKARQEAKGQTSAQSNFIEKYIQRLVALFKFSRDNAAIRSADYYEMIDPLFALIEMTGGRRDLPEGKQFGDMFIEVKKIIHEKMVKWEGEWQKAYAPFMEHLTNEILKIQEKNKVEA